MKQALDTRTKLLTKSPWPLMLELSIPAVLGMVVVGLYNMMDSIFVGQLVGDVQMGAVSVSYPFTLMDRLISCEFNMDTACVELKFLDGSMIAIDTIAVENEVADNMYQRSELDYLIYNDPIGYADLILNGNPETYLKTVTEYKPLDS